MRFGNGALCGPSVARVGLDDYQICSSKWGLRRSRHLLANKHLNPDKFGDNIGMCERSLILIKAR